MRVAYVKTSIILYIVLCSYPVLLFSEKPHIATPSLVEAFLACPGYC
jgi:hypothetical protein